MSVINQMLKDLEQRRAQGFEDNAGMLDDLDAGAVSDTPASGRSHVWLIVVVFLLAAIIATWMYLEITAKQDIKVVEVKSKEVVKPVEEIEPKAPVYKSVIQELVVKENDSSDSVVDMNLDEAAEKIVGDIKSDSQSIETVASKSADLEIKISNILPSPLLATGHREIITVYGQGFIAPLSVTMEWDAGRAFKELEPWQVKVLSETEIKLHVNLGIAEDEWRLLIKQMNAEQEAEYKFTVIAMPEQEPVVEAKPAISVGSFTKTNRTLSRDQQITVMFSKASLLMQQGKTRQAKNTLQEVLALDFSHLKARQMLAAILFREQAYDEAIEVLELGNIQHPTYVPFTLLLARIYTERGQEPLAIDLLERQQPTVAPNSEYYALLAALYQRGGQHNNAANVYKKLLVSFPSRAVWWMGLGLSLQSLQQNKQALDAYYQSLQTQGLNSELRRFVKTRITQLTG